MKYCAKLIFELPNTVEETKEILVEYYKDLLQNPDEIDEVVGNNIKTWDDVKEFLDTFCYDELNELGLYFEVKYEGKMVEKERSFFAPGRHVHKFFTI